MEEDRASSVHWRFGKEAAEGVRRWVVRCLSEFVVHLSNASDSLDCANLHSYALAMENGSARVVAERGERSPDGQPFLSDVGYRRYP